MVITVINVATPIVSPSIVSDVRSLCARSALKHCARLSRRANMDWKTLRLFLESDQNRKPRLAELRNPSLKITKREARGLHDSFRFKRFCRNRCPTGSSDQSAEQKRLICDSI